MQGKIHYADKVNGREPVAVPRRNLALDSESGIENGPLVEIVLWSPLELDQKPVSARISTLDIKPDTFAAWIGIDGLVRTVGDCFDAAVRDKLAKEK